MNEYVLLTAVATVWMAYFVFAAEIGFVNDLEICTLQKETEEENGGSKRINNNQNEGRKKLCDLRANRIISGGERSSSTSRMN